MCIDKNNKNLTAIIPAAGKGFRLGCGCKALLKIQGKTLLEHVIQNIAPLVRNVVVAAPRNLICQFTKLCPNDTIIIEGKDTRHDTIQALLNVAIELKAEGLLLQDAARPFATKALYQAVISAGSEFDAVMPTIKSDLFAITVNADDSMGPAISRDLLHIPQTPHFYKTVVLQHAYQHASSSSRVYTSTAELVKDAGYQIQCIPGEKNNFKITDRTDWDFANFLAEQMQPSNNDESMQQRIYK